ncbi:protein RMD5 homolog [Silene latifolia]|uniref:protein RMD5 homolog n=1 Tax=Silene latifolia TaxID=37657 RepID=UPI003D78048F
MELSALRGSFEHVAKKQKLSSSKCYEVVDTINNEIEQALVTLQSDQDPSLMVDHKSTLTQLKIKLKAIGSGKELESTQKELNTNITKYLKLLEKVFNPDISKAYRNVDFDVQTINEIVSNHFFRQGLFDIGECLMKEAGRPNPNAMQTHFTQLYQILEAIHAKNLQPALNWASANHEKLKQNGSSLALKLHQHHFVELLKQGKRDEALHYVKLHISPFSSSHMHEVQKLTICVLWIEKLDKCPYKEMLSSTTWETLADELSREFCVILGQPSRSPLTVTLEAGLEGLPILVKLATLMATKPHEWDIMKQLAVPLELGNEFLFHSTFVCPVSREEGAPDNPPMLLPCGHVLCRQSIMKMSKMNSRTFKCPYCPHDASVAQCRQLYF